MSDTNTQPELLPCPFCGKLPTYRREIPLTSREPQMVAYCETEGCPARRNASTAETWNTRAGLTTPLQADAEGVEKAVDRITEALGNLARRLDHVSHSPRDEEAVEDEKKNEQARDWGSADDIEASI